jgi:sugar lactone lactonase YvrE
VPLGKRGQIGTPQRLPLTGDWVQVPNMFGANGITATRNGRWLIVAQSVAPEGDGTSALYRVNPRTGVARRIEVEEGVVQNADGIELHGRTLYVVQNFSNSIAKLRMEDNFTEAEVRRVITDSDFRIPTTATRVGSRLWAVNARFGTTPGPNVDYEIVAVPR